MKHTIDAKGQKIGRVASKAAKLLIGKELTSYKKNSHPEDVTVEIINTSKCAIDTAVLKSKKFDHYTGYPGGLYYVSMQQIIKEKGYGELFRKAVYGMLPINKLRSRIIKKLIVKE